jgi:hypothetical protein
MRNMLSWCPRLVRCRRSTVRREPCLPEDPSQVDDQLLIELVPTRALDASRSAIRRVGDSQPEWHECRMTYRISNSSNRLNASILNHTAVHAFCWGLCYHVR